MTYNTGEARWSGGCERQPFAMEQLVADLERRIINMTVDGKLRGD